MTPSTVTPLPPVDTSCPVCGGHCVRRTINAASTRANVERAYIICGKCNKFIDWDSHEIADGTDPAGEQSIQLKTYQRQRQLLWSKYPNLVHQDYKQWTSYAYHPHGQLACIYFNDNNQPPTVSYLVNNHDVRHELLKNQSAHTTTRRLFLLEGCNDDRSKLLGAFFRIPHLFWMRHEKVAIWEANRATAGNLPSLPSTMLHSTCFTRSYCQMMHLGDEIVDFSLRCAENERHVSLSRSKGQLDGIGAVHRKVSCWARTVGTDGWDVVIVVDVPFRKSLKGYRESSRLFQPKIPPSPFQGGYADFLPYKDLDDSLQTTGPPRSSIFNDLMFYYTEHWSYLDLTADPRSVTLFVDKIIASEYLLMIQYQRSLLSNLYWSVSRHKDFSVFDSQWVAESWSDLMSFQRRLQEHYSAVLDISRDLALNTKCYDTDTAIQQKQVQRDWHDSEQDFNYIGEELLLLIGRTRDLVSAFTALSGAKAAEQSLLEAQNVRTLTILGVTFVPLSLVSGIFSMANEYGPGQTKFWLYFAVAVPLSVALLLIVLAIFYGSNLSMRKHSKNEKAVKMHRFYQVLVSTRQGLVHVCRALVGSRKPSAINSEKPYFMDTDHVVPSAYS